MALYQVWLTGLNFDIDLDELELPKLLVETADKNVALEMIHDECANSVGGDEAGEPAMYSVVLCEDGKPTISHPVSADYTHV